MSNFRASSFLRTTAVMIILVLLYLVALVFSGGIFLISGLTFIIINVILSLFSFSFETFQEGYPVASLILYWTIYSIITFCPFLIMLFCTGWLTSLTLKQFNAKKIEEEDNPELHKILHQLADAAEVSKPRLYGINESIPNACALGRDPNHGVIVVSSGLLDLLNTREIKGVLAHELAHIKNRDTLTNIVAMYSLKLMIILPAITSALLVSYGLNTRNEYGRRELGALVIASVGFLIAGISSLLGLMGKVFTGSMSRTREFVADRVGASLTGDPLGLASAVAKIDNVANNMNAKISPQEAHLFIYSSVNANRLLNRLFSTHPTPRRRIARLGAMASEYGDNALWSDLLESNSNNKQINSINDNTIDKDLMCAANEGNLEKVRKLIKAGADINVRDSSGCTPLHWAGWKGHLEIVQELIKAGTNVDMKNNAGETPLHWQSWKGHLEIVQELTKADANVNIKDIRSATPLSLAKDKHTKIVNLLRKHGAE